MIQCFKYTYMCYNQVHFCYCEHDSEKQIWAEGAILELNPLSYITSTDIVTVTQEEFEKHHYTVIQSFIKKANEYEG